MILEQGIGFDLETVGEKSEYGLQPCRALQGKASISAVSFSKAENPQGFLDPDPERLRSTLKQVADKGKYLVGWNVSFDAAWCIAVGLEAEVFAVKWLDAMLLWRHAVVEPEGENVPRNKRKSYALEAALKEFFPDQAGFKEFDDFQATDEESLRKLLHRNKEDARFTLKLGQLFWDMLNDRQRRAALIEAQCIPQVAWTKVHGIVSSKSLARDLSQKLKARAEDLHRDILESSPEVEGVNLGSSQQLQTLLYDTWGLPATRFSKKTKAPSTDKYALFDLALLDPRARIIKELREAKNNRTKYAEATIKSLGYNGDGRVRPQAKIFSTYTSRMSYSSSDKAMVTIEKKGPKKESVWVRHPESESFLVLAEGEEGVEVVPIGPAKTGSVAELKRLLKENGWGKDEIKQATADAKKQEIPREVKLVEQKAEVPVGVALHQWKRGKEYRDLIQSPEGFTLCELDFAGQEFGWMAVASGDETMLSLRQPGEDAHSYMGAQIAQIEYRDLIARVKAEDAHAELQRKLGKFANLSFQYRVSGKTATTKARVDYELDVKEAFINQILETYKRTYPGVPDYWRDQIVKCRALGYAETFAGRRVQLKGHWAGRDSWAMESTAINYPIQGTGGDQKYLALAVARNYLPQFGGYFYYELHDGLFFIFPNAVAEKAARFFRKVLSNLPYKQAWGVDLPIDFPVDAKTGSSWGELKEIAG